MIRTVIADDEKVIRNGLKKMLEASELQLIIEEPASNGIEALEKIKEFLPQIVLMDINMPGLKGLEVIEKAKEYIPDAKIIIISGHDDFPYVQRALQLGTFDYLLKPINKNELINVIKKAIDLLPNKAECGKVTELSTSCAELDKQNVDKSVVNNGNVVDKAIQYINENYKNSDLNLTSLSKRFFVSESYMTRIIKKKINKSFSTYITELRMEEAIKLLSSKDDIMVGLVAEAVGYSSHHYFCRVFKTYTGVTPIEFKNVREI